MRAECNIVGQTLLSAVQELFVDVCHRHNTAMADRNVCPTARSATGKRLRRVFFVCVEIFEFDFVDLVSFFFVFGLSESVVFLFV